MGVAKFLPKSVSFPGDSMAYVAPSWAQLDSACLSVAQQIRKKSLQFDRLVTLAKGGWPMTKSLVDFLQIPEVASLGIRFYGGIDQRLAKPEVYQDLPISVQGERVLLFDDVADTGESLVFARQHLIDVGVKSVHTATLYYRQRSVLKPDFIAQTATTWIVFPFDPIETMKLLTGRWKKLAETANEVTLDATELKRRFSLLGLPARTIEYYFQEYVQ